MILLRLKPIIVIHLTLLLLISHLSAVTEIHISQSGVDTNPGTFDKPVATPQAAQKIARKVISEGLTDEIHILFHQGTYHLTSPIELRPEDSGTPEFPITWMCFPKAEVTLSGGRQVTGEWTKGDDNIWHIDLKNFDPDKTNFRQLFVDGKRSPRARFPNASEDNPFLYATGGDIDHILIDPSLIKESWGTGSDVQINIVPHWKFFNQWNTVTGVDKTTGRINIADSERHGKVYRGNWFWIEGVKDELDEPGEWHLDKMKGRLFYMSGEEIDPNELEFIFPSLNRIINVKGDVKSGSHVSHVKFEGLKFRHTRYTLGHIEARVHTDTAVMFENASHCSVTSCHFENIGGYALWLHLDSKHNVFSHNTVLDSGGGGVLLTGARLSYMDDSKVYTPGEAASKVAPILNEITHNTVQHCGKIRYYGGGVHLDSRPFSMSMEPGNLIAHNYFNDLSRNGIFAFRNQGGNIVEYNHIHNAMQTTIDGACIHFATMNHLNAPNYILNNWLYDIWGYNQQPNGKPKRVLANGVFLDWDSSNTTVENNWIYNAGGKAIKPIWDNWNITISNNQISKDRIVPPFKDEIGPKSSTTNGIDLETNKLTGRVIHYTDAEHFSTTGKWTPQSASGQGGLFEFNYLVGSTDHPSTATYKLPIPKDGTYQISLLYSPGKDRATNTPITIQHAEGTSDMKWNMQKGSKHGFAVEVGSYRFLKDKESSVTLSTAQANGKVIADGLAFVKIEAKE